MVVPLDARILDALRRRGLCRMVHVACADVYVKQGDMLTISFRGRKVLLLVKSVVARGVKEDEGGVAVESHVLTEIL